MTAERSQSSLKFFVGTLLVMLAGGVFAHVTLRLMMFQFQMNQWTVVMVLFWIGGLAGMSARCIDGWKDGEGFVGLLLSALGVLLALLAVLGSSLMFFIMYAILAAGFGIGNFQLSIVLTLPLLVVLLFDFMAAADLMAGSADFFRRLSVAFTDESDDDR